MQKKKKNKKKKQKKKKKRVILSVIITKMMGKLNDNGVWILNEQNANIMYN